MGATEGPGAPAPGAGSDGEATTQPGGGTARFEAERGRAARLDARRRRRLGIAAIACVGVAFATMIQSFSWNQTSHYDLIRALNQENTTITPYQANTGDKVEYPEHSGHFYSARAPGLALFSLPFYDALNLVNAESWTRAHVAPPNHPGDEMIYLIGLWANVLPGALLLLLVFAVANRFEPGYGAATAVIVGLGTLVLPLSTLLFSHVFTAFLGFAAFWLMLRERDGPPSLLLLWLAGLAVGYAVASEYPVFFVGVVLGLFLLSRSDSFTVRGVATRAGAYILGGIVGIIPLLLYNHYAFHSWTHLAYSDVPRQHKGFFGIEAPSLKIVSTLLFDSRGLLTISPVLIMGAIGTVMLYRRGRRAESLTIGGVCLCYLTYNSGYYLPFGGGFMGPRFLTTMLPFLACPLGIALKRFPGPTVTLAGASIALTVIATITHPLVGYETETVVWERFLSQGLLQPTIASAYGLGRGWGGIWVFLVPAAAGLVLATAGTRRVQLTAAGVGWGVLALLGWALFAALAPRLLGIDHAGLESIYKAGDHTALNPAQPGRAYSDYPLDKLVPIGAVAGLLALGAFALTRNQRRRPRRARGAQAPPRTEPALSG
ncbi:MAG TPA: hypothetical protein VLZ06_07750 [Solirubrobacteraceae bacterium]|nr:hypothetical protein [Solirubrobacteraceae bacterium]